MFFDYHIHSNFSTDSKMSLLEICGHSLLRGLTEIAITDHHDLDYQSTEISFDLNRQEYLAALSKLKEEYAGKLRIKTGLELGLQPHILDECRDFVGEGNFDFVLGSFHTAQKKDLYRGDFFVGYTQWEAYREYLKDILYVVRRFDYYSVLGHLDVVRRYGNFTAVPDLMDDPDCHSLIEEIFKIIIAKGKGIEVNTSGYHFASGDEPLPSISILRLFREMGGEIITTGSDSHYVQQLGYRFKETYEMLRDMGYRYIATFDAGRPQFHPLD